MNQKLINQSIDQYIELHPNKLLLAYACDEMIKNGFHNLIQENSKFLFLTGVNMVACIAGAIEKKLKNK